MKTINFVLEELVHPNIFTAYGNRAWTFLQVPILRVIDELRIVLNSPIIINNWHWNGNYVDSGLREVCSSTGAPYSIHKFGGAMDLKFPRLTPQMVYRLILEDENKWYSLGLRRMENIIHTPTWLHLDCANTHIENKIHIFNV